jgi:hypothetical protein
LILDLRHKKNPPPRRQDAKKTKIMKRYLKEKNRRFSLRVCYGYWLLILLLGLFPLKLWAGEEQMFFLPPGTAFQPLIGDPREPNNSIILRTGQVAYEGAIGSIIELLQWRPADQSRWGWGILGAGFIGLGQASATNYPLRVVDDNGILIYNSFPELVSDWYLGTYFDESSGDFSNRFEYTHVSSHLGDELFDYAQRIIYTRESFRFTSSYQPSKQLRLYAGAGYYPHIAPIDKPFFLHGGAELYTHYFDFIAGTTARGYFTYDIKAKQEAGGVVNQAFQWGLEWRETKESNRSIRLALLYYNGNSEYGQFYLQNDNHWGVGFYFDP